MKKETITITKVVHFGRGYSRAQMNQRRVVGIVIVSIVIGAILGLVAPIRGKNVKTVESAVQESKWQ